MQQRDFIAGIVWAAAAVASVCAGTAWMWPDWPLLGTVARMLENLAFHGLIMVAGLTLLLARLGRRVWAGTFAAVALAGTSTLALRHVEHSLPLAPEDPVTLSLVWFNMLSVNETDPRTLVDEIKAASADLIILSEATPVRPFLDDLAEVFPNQIGCRAKRCEVLALARAQPPGRTLHLSMRRLHDTRSERLVLAELWEDGTRKLDVVAMHWVKPWFDGFVDIDAWYAHDITRSRPGPTVMVGDFNAAPWGKYVRDLLGGGCALHAMRRPIATWPARLGGAGVPIDLALVGGGARLSFAAPWGGHLGSNHRGLWVKVSVPPDGSGAPPRSHARAGCG